MATKARVHTGGRKHLLSRGEVGCRCRPAYGHTPPAGTASPGAALQPAPVQYRSQPWCSTVVSPGAALQPAAMQHRSQPWHSAAARPAAAL